MVIVRHLKIFCRNLQWIRQWWNQRGYLRRELWPQFFRRWRFPAEVEAQAETTTKQNLILYRANWTARKRYFSGFEYIDIFWAWSPMKQCFDISFYSVGYLPWQISFMNFKIYHVKMPKIRHCATVCLFKAWTFSKWFLIYLWDPSSRIVVVYHGRAKLSTSMDVVLVSHFYFKAFYYYNSTNKNPLKGIINATVGIK